MNELFPNPRLDAEWTAVNVLREVIRVGTRGNDSKATYDNALDLGGAVLPTLLGQDVSLLRRERESDLTRELRQKADAKQLKDGRGPTALQLAREEIAEVTALLEIARFKQKTDQLKHRLNRLRKAESELDPNQYSEHQLIFRDVYHVARSIPELKNGHAYRDFELPDENVLRIRVFHPERPEHISGADLIYERHARGENSVSIVAVQYKIWKDKSLPLNDKRMQEQIAKMKAFACDAGLCRNDRVEYRFPYCTSFLRPTDKLQSEDQQLHSTGEHLPICRIADCSTSGPRGGKKLEYQRIRETSLSQDVFENLFNTGRIGSRNLSYAELAEIYARLKVLQETDRLLIHAQDFTPIQPTKIK